MILDKHYLLMSNIIEELGLGPLGEKEKEALLGAMSELLGERITLKALNTLSEENIKTFESLFEKNPAQAGKFLVDNAPNILEIIKGELAKFKEEMIESVQE